MEIIQSSMILFNLVLRPIAISGLEPLPLVLLASVFLLTSRLMRGGSAKS